MPARICRSYFNIVKRFTVKNVTDVLFLKLSSFLENMLGRAYVSTYKKVTNCKNIQTKVL